MPTDAFAPFRDDWPRPPAALPAARLGEPPAGARVCVAGLVLLRQRPGTANGVVFVTLEDETGVVNIVVWAKVFERFRRAVIAGRLLRVTGRIQRESGVVHVVADVVEDISHLLDTLVTGGPSLSKSEMSHNQSHPPDRPRSGSRPPQTPEKLSTNAKTS